MSYLIMYPFMAIVFVFLIAIILIFVSLIFTGVYTLHIRDHEYGEYIEELEDEWFVQLEKDIESHGNPCKNRNCIICNELI